MQNTIFFPSGQKPESIEKWRFILIDINKMLRLKFIDILNAILNIFKTKKRLVFKYIVIITDFWKTCIIYSLFHIKGTWSVHWIKQD